MTGTADVAVTGVCLDSRRVLPGDLYAALPGATVHGARFVPQAAAAGAVAVLTDPDGLPAARDAGLPVVVVAEPRRVLGAVAAGVYGRPAAALRTIGVTGTQGKTTVTRLLDAGLAGAGVRSAVIGTVGTRIAGRDVKTALTTPEAPDLHGLFAAMREQDVTACAMEVSSHALVLGRVDGVVFDVAVFLNLGRDHLDFHSDVEDYYRAKASLFTPERARLGLVDVDDEHGRRLVAEAQAHGAGGGIPIRTLSARGSEADWRAVDIETGPDGSTFAVLTPDGRRLPAGVPLAGDFNVANALAAIAAAEEAGFDGAAVAAGIAAGPGVPGRLERVPAPADGPDPGFTVVVDYAHKPDAVAAVLRTLRPVTAGRLSIVIGAGGDRDTGKRPLMGEIAATTADLVIVTDDNPRSEDPALIRAAMLAGARPAAATSGAEVLEVAGRQRAIEVAIERAEAGDVVVVAGKGHETGQEIAGVVHPFDDREVVAALLAQRVAGAPGSSTGEADR
ncbi:UDP-N-acetylmuramoyl-L-alanyl-D-glutamate--2,6-diaminopimelate ligase [Nocardioides sp. GY 10113]|uniref:UDP-N-acetylmuramoyl-L-alanyl-D-glutamate--2, 6-diaminopimelate ligase n=1 Tax=Nocardioides sp. GY 10113 TaxID=2569761 RepID=UPI001F0FB6F9|nr:UDP-N-acetylmuramoyl-L-alanyl-D-glutamate--2,6-diaminopimelate ligase [Nocardioides sp. GY 10113]